VKIGALFQSRSRLQSSWQYPRGAVDKTECGLTTRCSGPPLLRFGEKPVPATYFRSALRAGGKAVSEYRCFGVSALVVPFFYSVTSPLRYPVTSFLRVLCDLCGENPLSSRPSAVSASGDASYNVLRLTSYVALRVLHGENLFSLTSLTSL
jgi:hypothetical protein